ncbi:HAD-IB family hydrolase [Halomonas sp. H10-9-1]|uniref:HAD-IB family hydrolase n=1 Tax=Halomonas sp. H10-9-1 TaxID=2950871 RepID=UPI0032DEC63B
MSHNDTPNARPVAFFDFDGTLTTGDTLMPFLKFVVGTPTYYAKLALVSPVLAAYFAKLLRNDIAKQIVLKQYLAGYHIDDLFERGQRFSDEVIPAMLRPEGMERLRWHQQQGHACVLISASLDLYLSPWARRYGFDALFSSQLATRRDGRASGALQGANCHGATKRVKLMQYLAGRNAQCTFGYGDSTGDDAMLGATDNGYRWNGKRFAAVS